MDAKLNFEEKQVQADIPVKPICELLDETVRRVGQKRAMDFLDRSWTYTELGQLVDRAAAGFRSLGVTSGVKVGLHLPNSPYFVICYFAILKAGGTVVNYNPLYVEKELAHQVQDSGTSIMVTMDLVQLYSKISPLVGKTALQKLVICKMADILPTRKSVLFRLFRRKDRVNVPHDVQHVGFEQLLGHGSIGDVARIEPASEVAVLQYTGGTTGVPKGATLTHGSISANVEQLRQWISMYDHSDDRMVCALPFFHVFGMTVAMLLGVAVGAELILLPRFEVKQVLKVLVKKRPTMFPGVPTIYIAINRAVAELGGKLNLNSIRCCISGGAPLPLEVQQEFQRITGCKLVEGYGLSEASPVVTCNPFDRPNREGSIGLPLPGTTIEIRSLLDPHKIVAKGDKGELCVRGPQVMLGYWQKPEATAEVMVDGALRTGDVAHVDEDGYIQIVDRIKDVIICSGFKIFPRVIEDALYSHPAIAEAVVVGLPDAYRGQTPKAFLKLKDGAQLTADELKIYLTDHLARHEMPSLFEFRQELPRTAVGKLSKKALLDEEMAKSTQVQA